MDGSTAPVRSLMLGEIPDYIAAPGHGVPSTFLFQRYRVFLDGVETKEVWMYRRRGPYVEIGMTIAPERIRIERVEEAGS